MRRGAAQVLAVPLLLLGGAAGADGIGKLQAAMREEDEGHVQISIVLYTAAIQDPALSQHDRLAAHFDRAGVYELSGDYEQAIGDYTVILQADPRNALAVGKRAEDWWLLGDVNKALADYDEALRLEPGNAALLCARGNLYRGRSDLAQALADYDRAVQLDQSNPVVFLNRALAYKDMADYGRALSDLGRALQLNPKYAKAYLIRAYTYRAIGDLEHAVADYDAVLRFDPRDATVYYNRANANAARGLSERAIADYGQAIALSPRNAWAYFNRAGLYLARGDYERAIADYQSTLAINDRNADAHFGLGNARFFSGRYAEAAQDISHALAMPSDGVLALSAGGDGSLEIKYRLIWRYLARRRAGQDGTEELHNAVAALADGDWPSPVIDLLLGRLGAEELLAAARDADPQQQRKKQCEANAYLGEMRLIGADRAGALPLLKAAGELCPAGYIEQRLALAELQRLAQP